MFRLRHPVKVVNQWPAVDGVDLSNENLEGRVVSVVGVHDEYGAPEVQGLGQFLIETIHERGECVQAVLTTERVLSHPQFPTSRGLSALAVHMNQRGERSQSSRDIGLADSGKECPLCNEADA